MITRAELIKQLLNDGEEYYNYAVQGRELDTRPLSKEAADMLAADAARIAELEAALADAEKIATTLADSMADAALTGLPEQARIREGMESAARKIAYQIAERRAAIGKHRTDE